MAHVPRIHVPGRLAPGPLSLDGEQAKRLGTVMRLKPGDAFLVFNGDGHEWQARVEDSGKNRVTATITELARQEAAPALQLDLAIGLVRPNRFETALEKCCEAGADTIRPLVADHTVRGKGDSANRQERWQRILVEAAEQCGRLTVPQLLEPLTLQAWLQQTHGPFFFGDAGGRAWNDAADLVPEHGTLGFAIGPEGGFSDEEAAAMRAQGGVATRLGPHILRTESAAIAATVLVRSVTG
ncbi:MAG: RsmE family RNA methyltransferase [Dehalococcoidia bacterium]|nr:RsmE family RNA methyltransferase [Dehalococcoidia bacterium]